MRAAAICAALVMSAVFVPASPASADACEFNGTLTPGGEIKNTCTVTNFGGSDGYVYLSVDEIVVRDGSGAEVGGPEREQILSWFDVTLETKMIVTAGAPTKDEKDHVDLASIPVYRTRCEQRIDQVTATSCHIGRVRRSGERFNSRTFRIRLRFRDEPVDQSGFGSLRWTDVYSIQFGDASLPSECPTSPCPPVYVR